jgi:uncharacterized membrane protein YdjX (TVP38/TMEM64 family)
MVASEANEAQERPLDPEGADHHEETWKESAAQTTRRFWQIWKLLDKREMFALLAFVVIFLAASAFADLFSEDLRRVLGPQPWMWPYIVLVIFSELVLPGSSLPLLPVFAQLRGWLPTAEATVIGWMLSAVIAFIIGRRYGLRLLRRFISEESLEQTGQAVSGDHLFRTVFFCRLVFPVGLVGYAVGVFTRMSWLQYTAASALGLVPYAYLLVHVATWPLGYRLAADVLGIIVTGMAYFWIRGRVVRQWRGQGN